MSDKFIGFIPARSGSKGVIGKNIRKIGDKTLIEWSIESALDSDLNQIILSSDSEDYLSIADKYPVIQDLRSSDLSVDNVQTVDVVLEYASRNLDDDDFLILLQPTCPFRSVEIINQTIKYLKEGYDSVVSIVDVEGNHPNRMKIIEKGILKNYSGSNEEDMRPRQDLPKVYLRSGSIYAAKIAMVKKFISLVPGQKVKPIIEKGFNNINIDTELDFLLAELVYKNNLL